VVASILPSAPRSESAIGFFIDKVARYKAPAQPSVRFDQLREVVVREPRSCPTQQKLRLTPRECEVAGADLEQSASTAKPSHERRLDPTREHERGAFGNVLGQHGQHLGRVALADLVHVVEHEHTILGSGDQGSDARNDGGPDGIARSGEGVEQARVDQDDLVDRRSDVP